MKITLTDDTLVIDGEESTILTLLKGKSSIHPGDFSFQVVHNGVDVTDTIKVEIKNFFGTDLTRDEVISKIS